MQRKRGRPINPDSLRQRALAAGQNYSLVWNRVFRLGWTDEKALSEPPGEYVTEHGPIPSLVAMWKGKPSAPPVSRP